VDPVDPVVRPLALAVQHLVDPVALAPADLGLAVPVARGPVAPADLAGTNRVAQGAMGDMDRVDLANPGVRGLVALADTILEHPEDRGTRDPVERFMTAQEAQSRTAVRVLSQDRARLALTPTVQRRARQGRMPGHLHPMRAVLHQMPADLDRTRPAEPTRRMEVTRRAEVTRRVAAILAATAAAILELSGRAHVTNRECLRAHAFQNEPPWVASADEENCTYRSNNRRHRRFGAGRSGRGN